MTYEEMVNELTPKENKWKKEIIKILTLYK